MTPQRLGDLPSSSLISQLAKRGLRLDLGAVSLRVRSNCALFAHQLRQAYRSFELDATEDWCDLHAQIRQPRGLRRWVRPKVWFLADNQQPFEPFPADSSLPHFEWASNWLIGRTMNNLLLFHAGVVERDGLALLMPATPGSGKSTLTAALSLRGWRLLSDEFGAWDPQHQAFVPILKPVALKNDAIDVILGFEASAAIGARFPKTRKGTVAHLAAGAFAVSGRRRPAPPGAVLLPRWERGSTTQLERVEPHAVFPALAYNAFNFGVLGATAFDAALRLARGCSGWRLVYSDLNEAIAAIDELWSSVRVLAADARIDAPAVAGA